MSLEKHVPLAPNEVAAIAQANHYYEGKLFEYPAYGEALAGYPGRPDLAALHSAADRLVSNLRQACLEAK
jgi:hypothetical protein